MYDRNLSRPTTPKNQVGLRVIAEPNLLDLFSDLPEDMLVLLFAQLEPKEVLIFLSVNHALHRVASCNRVSLNLFSRHFGFFPKPNPDLDLKKVFYFIKRVHSEAEQLTNYYLNKTKRFEPSLFVTLFQPIKHFDDDIDEKIILCRALSYFLNLPTNGHLIFLNKNSEQIIKFYLGLLIFFEEMTHAFNGGNVHFGRRLNRLLGSLKVVTTDKNFSESLNFFIKEFTLLDAASNYPSDIAVIRERISKKGDQVAIVSLLPSSINI